MEKLTELHVVARRLWRHSGCAGTPVFEISPRVLVQYFEHKIADPEQLAKPGAPDAVTIVLRAYEETLQTLGYGDAVAIAQGLLKPKR